MESGSTSTNPKPRIESPVANHQQSEPTSPMRMEAPGSSNKEGITSSRDVSPPTVRPGGSEDGVGSIENDIRDAVGLGIQDSEASSTGEREFGTTS